MDLDLASQPESPTSGGCKTDNIAQFPDLIKSIEKMDSQQKFLNRNFNRHCKKTERYTQNRKIGSFMNPKLSDI